jgi:hypothetical protein
VRRGLLIITLLFIGALTALTATDMARNGLTPLDLVAILILLFFSIAIVGALRSPPPPPPPGD